RKSPQEAAQIASCMSSQDLPTLGRPTMRNAPAGRISSKNHSRYSGSVAMMAGSEAAFGSSIDDRSAAGSLVRLGSLRSNAACAASYLAYGSCDDSVALGGSSRFGIE